MSSHTISPTLIEASRLIALRVNVLPLRPKDKRPALASWKPLQQRCQYDMDWTRVDAWLDEWFTGTGNNLAAVTGTVSEIVVLDVDDEPARAYVEGCCGWPLTPTVRTSKGWHLWFRHPGGKVGNGVKRQGLGLDVRGDGGYVVVPPSTHPSGAVYRWEVSPFDFLGGTWPPAPMPDGLVNALWPKPYRPRFPRISRGRSDQYVHNAVEREAGAVASAPEGTRNDTLNRAAFAVGRFVKTGELDRGSAEQVLIGAAEAAGLPEREARATVRSGLEAR